MDIYNNVNNDNNVKNEKSALEKTLDDFYVMRNKIKKPMTDKAKKLLFSNLEKLAGDNENLKIKILEQSILNCWQSVYALKDNLTKHKSFSEAG